MRVCSIVLAVALLGVSAPAATAQPTAEDTAPSTGQTTDDRPDDLPLPDRMERALRDMMEDVQPTLEGALDYLRSFGAIDDPRHYEMPEVLPNGDIIIRRREDAPELDAEPPDGPRDALPDDPGAPPARDLPIEPEDGIRT